MKPVLTYYNMWITQWIGIHGGQRHCKKLSKKISLFYYPLAIPHVIGVMSWHTNHSKTNKAPHL
ncbi:UNVERIFIED_CONTAM: hypothetical protein GTU68_024545 [Idotea baltica]|nr:hypothetical protein [Idotea baltica]